MAVEIPVIEPVLAALKTQHGWIGLLLGLGGRETVRTLRAMYKGYKQSDAPQ